MGGLASSATALHLQGPPAPSQLLLCVAAGSAAGGLWAMIPTYLKAYRGINEVIAVILLNFVAVNLVSYLAAGPMMQEDAPHLYSPCRHDARTQGARRSPARRSR